MVLRNRDIKRMIFSFLFLALDKKYNGIAYLGSRPTFNGKKIFLETNIFGIKKNLYKIFNFGKRFSRV